MLAYTKSAVSRNYAYVFLPAQLTSSEKSINSVLDYVSASPTVSIELIEAFYSATNDTLCKLQADRLSTKVNLKLARVWLGHQEWSRLSIVCQTMMTYCYRYFLCCITRLNLERVQMDKPKAL